VKRTKVNETIMYVGYILLFFSIVVGLIIGSSLTVKEPDEISELTGFVYEGEEVPHPQRWIYGIGVIVGGVIWGCLFLAISEALSRLQSIEYSLKRTNEEDKLKASS